MTAVVFCVCLCYYMYSSLFVTIEMGGNSLRYRLEQHLALEIEKHVNENEDQLGHIVTEWEEKDVHSGEEEQTGEEKAKEKEDLQREVNTELLLKQDEKEKPEEAKQTNEQPLYTQTVVQCTDEDPIVRQS